MSDNIKKVDAEVINAVASEMVTEAPVKAEKTAKADKPVKAVRKPCAKKCGAKTTSKAKAPKAEKKLEVEAAAAPKAEKAAAKTGKRATCRKKQDQAAPVSSEAKRRGRPSKKSKMVPVSFVYRGLPGMKVFLAGEFNDWDPKVLRMLDPQEVGFYSCEVMLAPGQYQYKLVINGIWREDPDNSMRIRNPFGTDNSLIVVETP